MQLLTVVYSTAPVTALLMSPALCSAHKQTTVVWKATDSMGQELAPVERMECGLQTVNQLVMVNMQVYNYEMKMMLTWFSHHQCLSTSGV